MTSRTIDIHCHVCKKYMHSETPDGSWNVTWVKKHYCSKIPCQEQQTFDTLKGTEPVPTMTQAELNVLMLNLLNRRKNKSL